MAKTARFLPTYSELLTPKRKLSESIASGAVLVRILWRWEYFECFCRASLKSLFVSHRVLLNAGPRPGGPRPTAHGPRPAARGPRSTSRPTACGPRSTSRPTARGPPHGPRPAARRPTSRPAARGPQIFGQWYIKAHAQIGISGVLSTVV